MGLMKKLTSVLVASSLVLGSVGMALAADEEQYNDSYQRLAAYEIVKGRLMPDGTTDPALDQPITRAELLKVIVMGFGYTEEQVNWLKGVASYADVDVNQWYAPYIALAKNVSGMELGYPDGTFLPNNQVKAIEALVFVLKFLGITPATGANWVQDNIAIALENGVITDADAQALLANPEAPADRGLAFAIVDAAFMTYKDASGKNVYQQKLDTEPPVLSVDRGPESVQAATITITGTVTGATELYAGSDAITFDAEGKFSYEAALNVGANTITFSAKDIVGNVATFDYVVERVVGAANAVTVEIANQIEAGSEVEMNIIVTDATGAPVEVDEESLNVVIGGEIGSYADGIFKAAENAGKGTITVTYGDLEAAVAEVEIIPGALAKVEAEAGSVQPGTATKLLAKDAYGNVIAGATFSEDDPNAFIEGDIFTATKAGQYKVTAQVGEATVEGTIGVYGKASKLVVEAPETVVANGSTKYDIVVKFVDDAGNVVKSADEDDYSIDAADVDFPSGVTIKDQTKTIEGVKTYTVTFDPALADVEIDLTVGFDFNDNNTITAAEKGTATVVPVAQVATTIKLEADEEYLATNDDENEVVITAKILDQVGKAMADDSSYEAEVKVSGPALLENGEKTDSIPLSHGSKFSIVPEDLGDTGTITVTASFPGLATGTVTVKAAVPGVPKALKVTAEDGTTTTADDLVGLNDSDDPSDNYVEYTVRVVDRNGVPVSGTENIPDSIKITFPKSLDEQYVFFAEGDDAFAALADENKTSAVSVYVTPDEKGKATFKVAGSIAGSFEITVAENDDDFDFDSVKSTVTIEAGKPAVIALTKQDVDVLRGTTTTGEVTAQLYDKFGNKLATAGIPIVFKSVDEDGEETYDGIKLNGDDEAYKTTTDANGAAKVTVEMASYVDEATIVVVDGDEDDDYNLIGYEDATEWATSTVAYDSMSLYVKNTIISSVSAVVVDGSDTSKRITSISADSENGVALKVTVKDNYGRAVTDLADDPARHFKLSSSISDLELDWDAEENAPTINEIEDGVYLIGNFVYTEAGSVDLTVEIASVASDLKVTRTWTVKAGEPAQVILAEADDDELKLEANKVTKVTLQVADQFGNAVNATANNSTKRVFLTVSDADGYVSFRNESGAEIEYVDVKAGRSTATFYIVTNAVEDGGEATITLKAYEYVSGDDDYSDNEVWSEVSITLVEK